MIYKHFTSCLNLNFVHLYRCIWDGNKCLDSQISRIITDTGACTTFNGNPQKTIRTDKTGIYTTKRSCWNGWIILKYLHIFPITLEKPSPLKIDTFCADNYAYYVFLLLNTGSGFGLQLTLNIEQYEYIKGPNTDAGIKVNPNYM